MSQFEAADPKNFYKGLSEYLRHEGSKESAEEWCAAHKQDLNVLLEIAQGVRREGYNYYTIIRINPRQKAHQVIQGLPDYVGEAFRKGMLLKDDKLDNFIALLAKISR